MQIQLSGQPYGGQASVEMTQNTKFYALNRRSASNGKNQPQRLWNSMPLMRRQLRLVVFTTVA